MRQAKQGDDARGQVVPSAARIYDEFFVPALFGQWPPHVLDAANVRLGARVLDVACGTGVLARTAAARVGPAGAVTGLDVNPGMLAVARRHAPGIEWREGRAEALPFAEASFDAVLCQFGLMFFDDRLGALREMLRVLRPGGMLAVAVWEAQARAPGYAAMAGLLRRLFGDEVAVSLDAPYCLGDIRALRALLAEAGLAKAEVRTIDGVARFPSIADWVRTDIKGWTLADRINDEQLARLQDKAGRELRAFVGPDGAVAFAHPAHVATAVKA
jgi:ubiquinone/menaquinone biosynthesis C-methylase UbiE